MALPAWLRWLHARVQARVRAYFRPKPGAGELPPSQLAHIVAQLNDAVVLTDAERRVVWVNAAFERLTGYSADEVRGQRPGSLLQCAATSTLTLDTMRRALDAQTPVTVEILNRSKAGREYWVELRIEPQFKADGRLQGYVAVQFDVTHRRQADAALRAGRVMLDRTGRIGGVGGWDLDLSSGLLTLTDQTCHILGHQPGFEPTLADCLLLCRAPARVALEEAIADGLAGRNSWDMELPLLSHDGRDIWVRVQAEVEYADSGAIRVVGALQDITLQHRLKQEVRQQAELLGRAIDAVDEPFILFDRDDRLVYCNPTFRSTFALSEDLLVRGALFEDILREGVRRGQYPAAAGDEEAWIQRRLAVHRDGGPARVQRLSSGRILRSVERRLPDGHRVGFKVDITELVLATEAAERADRAKGDFIATISHELRTPLQTIMGFSDLGRHFAQGHPQFEPMFQDIHDGGQRMLRLVNGLLDVSKIDGSQGSLQLKPGDLGQLAQDVMRELSPLAAGRCVRIVGPVNWPPLPVDVDAFRIQQVMRNVLANAIRFAPEGSVIDVAGADLGVEGIEVTVRDHGPGIPDAELDSIFEAFVQSSRTRNGSGGTGLGLTISRKIVRAHGGLIEAVQPAEGQGALLRLCLPRSASKTTTARAGTGLRGLRAAARNAPEITSTA